MTVQPTTAIHHVAYDSEEYKSSLKLRHRYLRAPLGLDFTETEMQLDRQAVHLLAFAGEEILGCVIGQPQGDSVKIRQMVVTEAARSRGIGKRLIKVLEAHFIEVGICHFTMHARQDAVHFYEKLGYRKVGEPFTEIGIPHQRLDKLLIPEG